MANQQGGNDRKQNSAPGHAGGDHKSDADRQQQQDLGSRSARRSGSGEGLNKDNKDRQQGGYGSGQEGQQQQDAGQSGRKRSSREDLDPSRDGQQGSQGGNRQRDSQP